MIRAGEFLFTNLSASGYIWSDLTPLLDPAPRPVLIRDITFLALPCNKFLLDCKNVKIEVSPCTFQVAKPFQVRGEYYCDRNHEGRIECIHLSLGDKLVSIHKGECKTVPIPNGEIFLFLPDLCKRNRSTIDSLVEPQDSGTPEFYTDHDWTEELHFNALFPLLA